MEAERLGVNARVSLLLFLWLMQAAVAPVWSIEWLPPEVVGYRKLTRERILEALPTLPSGAYQANQMDPFRGCGQQLKTRLDLAYAHLSVHQDDAQHMRIYIDVVERGEEARLAFAVAPSGRMEIPAELTALQSSWSTLLDSRRARFAEPPLVTGAGGLDAPSDSELHALALQLAAKVPPQRALLLSVAQGDARSAQRLRAVTLLNWAGAPQEVLPRMRLRLADPSREVRDQAARYCLQYLHALPSRAERLALGRAVVALLQRPYRGDRELALLILARYSVCFPAEREGLYPLAREPLERLRQQSVQSQVRADAAKLLRVLR